MLVTVLESCPCVILFTALVTFVGSFLAVVFPTFAGIFLGVVLSTFAFVFLAVVFATFAVSVWPLSLSVLLVCILFEGLNPVTGETVVLVKTSSWGTNEVVES